MVFANPKESLMLTGAEDGSTWPTSLANSGAHITTRVSRKNA